jgi:hypothetical protein
LIDVRKVRDPSIVPGLKKAVEAVGVPPRFSPHSHGRALSRRHAVRLLQGGVSDNPLESINVEDYAMGLAAFTRFVRDFRVGS